MTGIMINVTRDGDLINSVHLGTLKSIDNAPPIFKVPH